MKYDGLHPRERLTQTCAQASERLVENGDAITESQLERIADNLATQAAYVRDQLNDKPAPWSREGQRSMGTITRRVRKALGYSYP